ncbi:MAG: (d)CMP kinase [Gammaproteobacteria bacterium]|nr:(d)CMP kinase [Gammaproteobacteria bacterium]
METSRGIVVEKQDIAVVAIDGPSGTGKGTIARQMAEYLGWHLLDSGALYRLTVVAAQDSAVALDDESALASLAAGLEVRFASATDGNEQIFLGQTDVTDDVRNEETGKNASKIAAMPAVRTALMELQRSFREVPGLVADGRDMGNVVFPDAPVKIFLTASPEERAQRRHKQLKDKGINVSLPVLSADIAERDRRDTERAVAPLRPASDAEILDTTSLSIDEVVERVKKIVARALSDR